MNKELNHSSPQVKEESDVIRDSLISAIHQLFSKINSISIEAIFKAPEIVAICSDQEFIYKVILDNKTLTVVDGTVRLNTKAEQNTLILRDIPTDAPPNDVAAIFSSATSQDGSACPIPISVRPDMNNTWFVTFPSEAVARIALQAISGCVYENVKVKARLKTESALKYQTGNSPYYFNTGANTFPYGQVAVAPPDMSMYYGNGGPTSNGGYAIPSILPPYLQNMNHHSMQMYPQMIVPSHAHIYNQNNYAPTPQYPNQPLLYSQGPPPPRQNTNNQGMRNSNNIQGGIKNGFRNNGGGRFRNPNNNFGGVNQQVQGGKYQNYPPRENGFSNVGINNVLPVNNPDGTVSTVVENGGSSSSGVEGFTFNSSNNVKSSAAYGTQNRYYYTGNNNSNSLSYNRGGQHQVAQQEVVPQALVVVGGEEEEEAVSEGFYDHSKSVLPSQEVLHVLEDTTSHASADVIESQIIAEVTGSGQPSTPNTSDNVGIANKTVGNDTTANANTDTAITNTEPHSSKPKRRNDNTGSAPGKYNTNSNYAPRNPKDYKPRNPNDNNSNNKKDNKTGSEDILDQDGNRQSVGSGSVTGGAGGEGRRDQSKAGGSVNKGADGRKPRGGSYVRRDNNDHVAGGGVGQKNNLKPNLPKFSLDGSDFPTLVDHEPPTATAAVHVGNGEEKIEIPDVHSQTTHSPTVSSGGYAAVLRRSFDPQAPKVQQPAVTAPQVNPIQNDISSSVVANIVKTDDNNASSPLSTNAVVESVLPVSNESTKDRKNKSVHKDNVASNEHSSGGTWANNGKNRTSLANEEDKEPSFHKNGNGKLNSRDRHQNNNSTEAAAAVISSLKTPTTPAQEEGHHIVEANASHDTPTSTPASISFGSFTPIALDLNKFGSETLDQRSRENLEEHEENLSSANNDNTNNNAASLSRRSFKDVVRNSKI